MNTHVFVVRRAAALGLAAGLAFGVSVPASAQSVAQPETQPAQQAAETALQQPAQPAIPVLSPEAQAMKSALERKLGAGSPALAAYAARGYTPIWMNASGGASDAARALVSVLEKAASHALPASKYGGATLARRIDAASADTGALEADLTAAYITYAQDVSSGLLTPRRVDSELHVFPERPDAGALVEQAARTTDMAAHLDSLPPSDPIYRRLVERYAAFRLLGSRDIWGPAVAKGRTLRPGNRNQRVAQVRARLTAMGDLDPNVYDAVATAQPADGTQVAANDINTDVPQLNYDPTHFDDQMVEALRRFQGRHGLNLDGVIGPATLKQINVSPTTRAQQIAVNLERLRWMNRDLGTKHILVNLAGFTMDVMNSGRSEFSSRVVVGKAREHRTPEFSDSMTHMVINPSWYVPSSIAKKEILPKVAADPGYLARRNMVMKNGRIIQRPGRGNALGTVKFMFPNKFAIYLHDTPSKRLFKRDVRAYSHGCVRVERPHDLAAFLLKEQAENPEGYFKSILRRGRERRVNLEDPLPVHLTYRSAWIDELGIEQFRGDIYGRDRKIARALEGAGVSILQ